MNSILFLGLFVVTSIVAVEPSCAPGQYLKDAECTPCEACVDDTVRTDCFDNSPGQCTTKSLASPTPLCGNPVDGTNINWTTVLSLGGHSFEEVFGLGHRDFQCSAEMCDGRQTHDSTQCTRARACDTVTCMTEITSASEEPRACPVFLDSSIDGDEWKVHVLCQPCSKCGDAQMGFHDVSGWGEGCARECTQLLCNDGEVYDWTDKRCKPCTGLWNPKLCVHTGGMDVTGHLHRVRFMDCVARGGQSDTKYGPCSACSNDENECGTGWFPDSKCGCSKCKRENAFSRMYVDMNNAQATAYCQIAACEAGKTGVLVDGTICKSSCTKTVCNRGERNVPCLLPHDTRCVPIFPRGHSEVQTDAVNASANLLETTFGPWHGWASFENVLVTLSEPDWNQEQCAWNSAGILDNVFLPGGISAVFWPAGISSAAEYKNTGTQKCRARASSWDAYPLLPLQNTVSFEGDLSRRVLVNSTLRVVSYAYVRSGYEFRNIDSEQITPDVGQLLAVVSLEKKDVVLMRFSLPTDRNVASWARWWRLSLFVHELTQIPPWTPIASFVDLAAKNAQFPVGGVGTRVTLNNPPFDSDTPPMRAHFVSAAAEMLFVFSDGVFIASNASVDVFDCVKSACAALALGGQPDPATPQTFFNESIPMQAMAIVSIASTPRGHRCLTYTSTIVGIFCVSESLLPVTGGLYTAIVHVGDASGVVLAYSSASLMLTGWLFMEQGVSCVVNGPDLYQVLAMSPGARPQDSFLVLSIKNSAPVLSRMGMRVSRSTSTVVTYWLHSDLCTLESFHSCAMVEGVDAIFVACVDGDGVRVHACMQKTVVAQTVVDVSGQGMLSMAIAGTRVVLGRQGSVAMLIFNGTALVEGYTAELHTLFYGAHFTKSSGGYVLFDDLQIPSYTQCDGWHRDELLEAGIEPSDGQTCFSSEPVSRGVVAMAWVSGTLVYPKVGGVFTRSAVALASGWLHWSPAVMIEHRGVRKYASRQSLVPTASGGYGSVYVMPSAVMVGTQMQSLDIAWDIELGDKYGLFVFVQDSPLSLWCGDVLLARCSGKYTAVQWLPADHLMIATCFPGLYSIKAETTCGMLIGTGRSDLAMYSTEGGERTTADLTDAVTLAAEFAATGKSAAMCVHGAEAWWTCRMVVTGVTSLTVYFSRTDEYEMLRHVGVDDVQVLPMLAEYTPIRSGNESWTTVYVPLATELSQAGVAGALRQSEQTPGWQRLHVLVGVFCGLGKCEPAVRLKALADNMMLTPNQFDLQAIGCNATGQALSPNMAYASCGVEIPTSMLNAQRLVRLTVTGCANVQRIDVSIPPHMSLYECAPDEFFSIHLQLCVKCGGQCTRGTYSTQCSALSGTPACQPCQALSEHQEFEKDCAWRCVADYWRDGETCRPCSTPACGMGQQLVPCTQQSDAVCVSCPSQTHARFMVPGTCSQVCDTGYFRSERGVCEPCSTTEMLRAGIALLNHGEFYRLHNCTPVSDSFFELCQDPAHGSYVNHGTAPSMDCTLQCSPGFFLVTANTQQHSTNAVMAPLNEIEMHIDPSVSWTANTCKACAPLTAADNTAVPSVAYVMDSDCMPSCVPPYQFRGGTCRLCNENSCAIGKYLTGVNCDECRPCVSSWTDTHFRFVSPGTLDANSSCREQCAVGMFNEYGLGLCKNYSTPVCSSTQFLRAGSLTQDYECRECASCAGMRLVQACGPDHDTQCASCGEPAVGEKWNGTTCERICKPDFVLNTRTRACELCVFTCEPGYEPARHRDNCTHCQACTEPTISNWEWVSGCEWACQIGFELHEGTCQARTSNEDAPSALALRVRCPSGTTPTGLFDCKPCTVSTVTPPESQENVTWMWLDTGEPCQWTCMMPLVKHVISVGVACISWERYKRSVTVDTAIVGSSGIPNPTTLLNTLNRWEVFVAMGCLVLLILIIVIVKVS